MISTLLSVLPPSMTTYSRFGYPCSKTERIVASRKSAWLYDGVTTVSLGQGRPVGAASGSRALSAVHGQPVLCGGGGGRSARLGQRTAASAGGLSAAV